MVTGSSDSLGKNLCRILGLDPYKTKSIKFYIYPEEFCHVEVEQLLLTEESKKIERVIKHFKLIENEEDNKNIPERV